MKSNKEGARALKNRVLQVLREGSLKDALAEFHREDPLKIINALFGFIQNTEEKVKWAAVTAMGDMVSRIAANDLETARVILRRLMWNLNDESGGIGWGSPEAMGEILARNEVLAEEFGHVLMSYAMQDGNYIEYDALQRGLLWGIGRLAQARPRLVRDNVSHLLPYLQSEDAVVRALSARVIGIIGDAEGRLPIEKLMDDKTRIQLHKEGQTVILSVGEVAKEALEKIRKPNKASTRIH